MDFREGWTLNVATVPEPETYAMFVTILIGAAYMVRRERKASSANDGRVAEIKSGHAETLSLNSNGDVRAIIKAERREKS